ncbi:MAG: hypothetical protein ACTSWR_11515 [Candidatus Helarchaeota archaeon]
MSEKVFVFNPEVYSGLKTSDLHGTERSHSGLTVYSTPRDVVYSGVDALPIFVTTNGPVILYNVVTLSYSAHTNKIPVRVLGRKNPKGYTSGGRTIAGTIIFISGREHPLAPLIEKMGQPYAKAEHLGILSDEIEPFDIIIRYTNEVGYYSYLHLYRVEFIDEGQTTSANDLGLEYVFQYVAYDYDILTSFTSKPLAADLTNPEILSLILYQQLWGDVEFQEAFSVGLLPVTGPILTADNFSIATASGEFYSYLGQEVYNIQTRRDLINKWADPHTYPWNPTYSEEFNPSTSSTDPTKTYAHSEESLELPPPVHSDIYPPADGVNPPTDEEEIVINRFMIVENGDGTKSLFWEISGYISAVAILLNDKLYDFSNFSSGNSSIRSYVKSGDIFKLKVWKYSPANVVTDKGDVETTLTY